MKRKIVLVAWADAHAHEDGTWVQIHEIVDKGEYIVTSVGILLEAGDGGQTGHVSIAQTIGPDEFADHIINIPNGMVRSFTVLGDTTMSVASAIPQQSKELRKRKKPD